MDSFVTNGIEKTRKVRDKILNKPAKFLIKLKVNASLMSTLSLLSGIIGAYYLFDNYLLSLLFMIIHLLADSFDGVIARIKSTESEFGKYLDSTIDRLITLAILVRIFFILGDYYIIIIGAIFVLTQSIHLISDMKSPVMFSRTTALIILFVLGPLISVNFLAIATYLTIGAISLYSLMSQGEYYLKKKFKI
ncbi:CDP-alcohol phosphatidyltransferase family protein [archaeon]|nr:CDP-alcohol phosphatidyltransferase family protein [archaeon]MBT3450421.1 CDP-alcohol phosphatidyltransferase family protein [archaeon]MBT6869164.1 CDP-alcohol phosphatidyltransferase family protein [archaeon]MBT7192811.1 CDP-alcohol phosphatidyltransferase family protein [archaeon]MBT7381351.1 CDP-alcohol phosphatidyltransferase family protein [archaeon]